MKWFLAALYFWFHCFATDPLLAADEAAGPLQKLSHTLREAKLDPEACYRVRDFAFRRNEVRLFLTEGVLIFRQPVNGVRTAAVFIASEATEDAEIVVIPPNRMERRSLASFTGSPNLNEHVSAAVFLFTDGTGERWLEELRGDDRITGLEIVAFRRDALARCAEQGRVEFLGAVDVGYGDQDTEEFHGVAWRVLRATLWPRAVV